MALVLNDEQLMLRDAAKDFLSAQAPVSHLRALRDSRNADGFSRQLWRDMVAMGWAAIVVPEKYGGLGYGFAGMGLVLEECGRNLTSSPLLSTSMAAAAAIARDGSERQKANYLPGIASGEHLFALAIDEGAHHNPSSCDTVAAANGEGFSLSGVKSAVVDGGVANTLIVTAKKNDGSTAMFLVPGDADGVTVTALAHLDTHHAATVTISDVALGEQDELKSELGVDFLLDVARIGQSAELLGIALEVLERTVEYLNDRKQFGVPIGMFQSLTHRAAKLYTEIELCKSTVLNALRVLDTGTDDITEIASLTKAKLSEVTHLAAIEGVQMHGGMGMTDECDIGLFLKRCRIIETVYGDRYFHLDRFARIRGY